MGTLRDGRPDVRVRGRFGGAGSPGSRRSHRLRRGLARRRLVRCRRERGRKQRGRPARQQRRYPHHRRYCARHRRERTPRFQRRGARHRRWHCRILKRRTPRQRRRRASPRRLDHGRAYQHRRRRRVSGRRRERGHGYRHAGQQLRHVRRHPRHTRQQELHPCLPGAHPGEPGARQAGTLVPHHGCRPAQRRHAARCRDCRLLQPHAPHGRELLHSLLQDEGREHRLRLPHGRGGSASVDELHGAPCQHPEREFQVHRHLMRSGRQQILLGAVLRHDRSHHHLEACRRFKCAHEGQLRQGRTG